VSKSICEYKECGKEFEQSKFGLKKYCNSKCKSRANQLQKGKGAKELICVCCKNPFKRKSAKDIKCVDCRTPKAPDGSLAKQYPVMDREVEIDLINKWLSDQENKIKVA